MGNSFICSPIQYVKDIKLKYCCIQKQNIKNENVIILDLNDEKIKNENNINKLNQVNQLNQLKNYFNGKETENEIGNNINKRGKTKKHLNIKKHNNDLNRLSVNKYELMLKRLLEQKKVKRNGPKRRETIRNNDKNIKILINEILFENLNEIKNNKNNAVIIDQDNDLLIKNINSQKYRNSATLDKNKIISNNLSQNIKRNIFNFQYRNTINEIINESSGCSGFCKQQTKQTISPKKKE